MIDAPLFQILDVCENRHRGNPASVDANKRVDKHRDREKVMAIIREGRTYSKAIARRMGREIHQISGRLSEAKALGLIKERRDLERIEGCWQIEVISNG